tara:strand:- start:291 stop:692 length:402 start_codon:yes stop_codon:yes gene_type:complete
MANTIAFDLVSPDRLLVSTEAEMVVVPGTEGDFGAMAGHQPMISALRPGVVAVHNGGSIGDRYFVRGGFVEVTNERCTILAEEAIPVADLDRAAIEQRIKDAEEDLADAVNDEERHRGDDELRTLNVLLAAGP